MGNQYHSDDQLDEILMWLDNAHDQFKKRYGKDCPVETDMLRNTYEAVLAVIWEYDPVGLVEVTRADDK